MPIACPRCQADRHFDAPVRRRAASSCYALEIDPRYAQVAIERWQAFTGREAVKVDG